MCSKTNTLVPVSCYCSLHTNISVIFCKLVSTYTAYQLITHQLYSLNTVTAAVQHALLIQQWMFVHCAGLGNQIPPWKLLTQPKPECRYCLSELKMKEIIMYLCFHYFKAMHWCLLVSTVLSSIAKDNHLINSVVLCWRELVKDMCWSGECIV